MSLFFNKSGEARFLLFVGESCPSNCFLCNNRNLRKKYYPYDNLKNNILFLKKKVDKNSELMLFYTDAVFHPNIEDFIQDETLNSFKMFTLQTHPIYFPEYWKRVNFIVNKNKNILFHVCNFYLNENNFDNIKYYTQEIIFLNWRFDIDFYFDFLKYKNLLKEYLAILPWKISYRYLNWKIRAIKLEYKNVEVTLYYQGEQVILEDKKYITNVYYTQCISESSFVVKNDKIWILEEVAFLPNGDITFHRNTLCSKSLKKISSVKKNNSEIVKDFLKLKEYLSKFNNWEPMGYNCYQCIVNEYDVDKIEI